MTRDAEFSYDINLKLSCVTLLWGPQSINDIESSKHWVNTT